MEWLCLPKFRCPVRSESQHTRLLQSGIRSYSTVWPVKTEAYQWCGKRSAAARTLIKVADGFVAGVLSSLLATSSLSLAPPPHGLDRLSLLDLVEVKPGGSGWTL